MKVGIPYDSTEYIQDAISEVLRTLTETLLIVIVVIFLFLGSFRSVLIPIVAIPISLIGAVFLMLLAGFTVNLLTLLAIVLSVGLVVDDAIVMVENVERHLHEGKPPHRAAIDAARELVGPIIAMTITLAAVYAPLGIQGGLTGSLVPRVRVHAGRRGHRFRGRGTDAVADDGRQAAPDGRHRARVRRLDQSPVRKRAARVHAIPDRDARLSSGRPRSVGDRGAADRCRSTCSRSASWRPPRTRGSSSGSSRHRPTPRSIRRGCSRIRSTTSTNRSRKAPASFRSRTPTGGFGGMVTKPWSERTKTTQQIMMESMAPLSKIAGVRVIPQAPPPLPGGGNFPVDLVIASAAEPKQLSELAEQLVQESVRQRPLHLRRRRPEVRSAAGRSGLRSRQAALAGRRAEPGRPRSVDVARRQLRQPVQHSRGAATRSSRR